MPIPLIPIPVVQRPLTSLIVMPASSSAPRTLSPIIWNRLLSGANRVGCSNTPATAVLRLKLISNSSSRKALHNSPDSSSPSPNVRSNNLSLSEGRSQGAEGALRERYYARWSTTLNSFGRNSCDRIRLAQVLQSFLFQSFSEETNCLIAALYSAGRSRGI